MSSFLIKCICKKISSVVDLFMLLIVLNMLICFIIFWLETCMLEVKFEGLQSAEFKILLTFFNNTFSILKEFSKLFFRPVPANWQKVCLQIFVVTYKHIDNMVDLEQ